MLPCSFPQQNKIFSGGQDMIDVPAHDDGESVTCCFRLSAEDIERINQTGMLFASIRSSPHFYPIWIGTANPFRMPREIQCSPSIVSKIFLQFIDDMEIVVLLVEGGQHAFKCEERPEGLWGLSFCHDTFGKQRFDSDYFFGEPLKVLGKVNELHGEYDILAKALKAPLENVLIMERVIATKPEEERY